MQIEYVSAAYERFGRRGRERACNRIHRHMYLPAPRLILLPPSRGRGEGFLSPSLLLFP